MRPLRLLTSEIGAAAIEHAQLGVFLAVVIAGSVALTGAELAGVHRTACGAVSTATGGGAC